MNPSSPTAADFEDDSSTHWVARAAFPVLSAAFFATQGALIAAVYWEIYWLAVPLVLIASHFMHGILIGFHEASHGMLRNSRRLNEIDGVIIGTLSLTSFSLYRAAHQTHHAFLSTQRDEELWPFVDPTVPRWARLLAAFLELTVGLVFTPFLFIRTFFRANSPIRNKRVRRRIWIEFIAIVVVWTSILTIFTLTGAWKYFFWVYLAPGALAANMQSVRKYIEHVGMTGETINGCTRSIVADTWLGKVISFTLLHEPYHGVHHQHAGLPHSKLPAFAHKLEPRAPGERPPFRSYGHAFVDLIHCLADPRVGPQWHADTAAQEPGRLIPSTS